MVVILTPIVLMVVGIPGNLFKFLKGPRSLTFTDSTVNQGRVGVFTQNHSPYHPGVWCIYLHEWLMFMVFM